MSLRLKLLLPLALTCLTALAYLQFVWVPDSLESQQRQYLGDVERHIDTVSEGLVPLMLTNQLDLIHENLGELRKQNPEWSHLRLVNLRGQQLYPLRSGDSAQAAPGPHTQLIERQVRFLGKPLGVLSLHVDYGTRLEELRAQHRRLALLVVVIIVALALIWTATLEFAVVQPLHELSAAAGELAQQRFDVALPAPDHSEVGLLVNSFAAMRDSLARYRDELVLEVAAHKRAEEEKSALNASLEERVAQRTAALQQAFRDLEAFSYSVSHDLRTPLRAINGFARIVLEEEGARLAPESLHMLERIAANGAKLGELIDDILAYSRSGRAEMKVAEVDMEDLARQIADELGETAERARVLIGVLPPARGDAVMLGQVLRNLIGNAVKFSAQVPTPRVEVGSFTADGETTYYVRDNGVGFDPRYADKLFGMFQRLHSDGEFPGSGVGLAIVKRLVERHGGRVWAESAPGQGASFYFTLGKTDA